MNSGSRSTPPPTGRSMSDAAWSAAVCTSTATSPAIAASRVSAGRSAAARAINAGAAAFPWSRRRAAIAAWRRTTSVCVPLASFWMVSGSVARMAAARRRPAAATVEDGSSMSFLTAATCFSLGLNCDGSDRSIASTTRARGPADIPPSATATCSSARSRHFSVDASSTSMFAAASPVTDPRLTRSASSGPASGALTAWRANVRRLSLPSNGRFPPWKAGRQ